jgi:glycosyltransferase involved in cell wall biosynthesis
MHPFEPQLGYSEYYLAKEWQRMGHRVIIVTSDIFKTASKTRCKNSGYFNEEGINVLRLFTFFEIFNIPVISLHKFKRFLLQFSPDIVQIQGIMTPLSVLAIFYKRVFGYKVVASVISGEVTSKGLILSVKLALLRIYNKLLLPLMSSSIDYTLVCSEAALVWNRDIFHIPLKKICFVPFGADSKLFRFSYEKRKSLRSELNINDRDVVAIYTGKLVPHKKLGDLLRASAPLIHQNENFKLLLVGNGSPEHINLLKSMAKTLQIERNVIFHDAVYRTMLPSFYSASDVAVWPGSISISIIEAMSMSLPVIIKQSKWTHHLLENENGFSFKEGDVEALRSCISTLIDNKNLRRYMGQKSRKVVDDKLNWDSIARLQANIYRSCFIAHNNVNG